MILHLSFYVDELKKRKQKLGRSKTNIVSRVDYRLLQERSKHIIILVISTQLLFKNSYVNNE